MERGMRATTMRGADLDVERIGEGPPILFVHGDIVGAAAAERVAAAQRNAEGSRPRSSR